MKSCCLITERLRRFKKMQVAGYIEWERSADDERVVVITLTKKGKAVQKKLKTFRRKFSAVLTCRLKICGRCTIYFMNYWTLIKIRK